MLPVAVGAYIAWKVSQSPDQALQFAFNGLSVGAVYALVAIGFTLVYSTVWFFDLYYGAAAALGAYGVFYLRSQQAPQGQYEVSNIYVDIVFAAVVAGVVLWALHEGLYTRLRTRLNRSALLLVGGLLAAGAGVYTLRLAEHRTHHFETRRDRQVRDHGRGRRAGPSLRSGSPAARAGARPCSRAGALG